MSTPAIKLVAYEDRLAGFIFVGVPDERGRYLRTDRSVALVSCPMCGSLKGEPCKGSNGYGGTTHVIRRTRAGVLGRPLPGEDVVTVDTDALCWPVLTEEGAA